jgi:hypothetical protein
VPKIKRIVLDILGGRIEPRLKWSKFADRFPQQLSNNLRLVVHTK